MATQQRARFALFTLVALAQPACNGVGNALGLSGGSATEVDAGSPMPPPGDGAMAGLPPDHPPVNVDDPQANNDHVGRAPRRLSVDQLRGALVAATGHTWITDATIEDPTAPTGRRYVPNADVLNLYAGTLGRADYLRTTTDTYDPNVPFSKLAGDAARSACAASVAEDATLSMDQRRIVRMLPIDATFASNAAGVQQNLSYLALRFWGRQVAPESTELIPLVALFQRASSAPAGTDANGTQRAAATPADGWRAVCVAMANDPQFLTY